MKLVEKKRPSLGHSIVERARELDRRLREQPFGARLLEGDVDRDEYAAWLVQLHKYVRFTVPGEEALVRAAHENVGKAANARALRSYAEHEADEERGHDDLLVSDLAVLWDLPVPEALERLEREPCAPPIAAWASLAGFMHGSFPEGIVGFGLALETLASLQSDETRASLLERGAIERIGQAVRFLEAHSAEIEGDHASGGTAIADALQTPDQRSAALFFAEVALAMFESTIEWLDRRFASREAPLTASALN